MSLCLAAGALAARLALDAFTLGWTHSIEKIRWEEDWHVSGQGLALIGARVRGSGAGMEPPAGASLRDGVWHYVPERPPSTMLRLTHSPHAAGYEICIARDCRPLADLLPGLPSTTVIELAACP